MQKVPPTLKLKQQVIFDTESIIAKNQTPVKGSWPVFKIMEDNLEDLLEHHLSGSPSEDEVQ